MSNELMLISGVVFLIFVLILIRFLLMFRFKKYQYKWYRVFSALGCSSSDFYSQFITALHFLEVKDISVRFIYLKEGFTFFHKCKCLNVSWNDINYELCVLNLGDRYFVSWRLNIKNHFWPSLIYKIPFVGFYTCSKLFPNSIRKLTRANLFKENTQEALMSIIKDNSISESLVQLK